MEACVDMCCVAVILLATRVHGLVHVVAPGPVPVRAGGRTLAAVPALARGRALIRRALEAGLVAAAVPAPAPGIEMC